MADSTQCVISVFGCGYLGATHAAILAHQGHTVIGIDSDAHKVAALQAGHVPFHEPELSDIMAREVASGRLTFSTDPRQAASATTHFICVGTPQSDATGRSDLSQIDATVRTLRDIVSAGDVVVGKSTVPVGTAREIREALLDRDVEVVWNPEFLREGFAVQDSLLPDRIVIGHAGEGRSIEAVQSLENIYAPQVRAGVAVVRTDLATAELVKTSANAFLALKISYINSVADICEAAGGRIDDLAYAIGLDARISPHFLRAGVGFGGGCLPKDIRSLSARSREVGAARLANLLDLVDAVNLEQRERIAQRAQDLVSSGGHVCIWGMSFKPDSDDIRDSPAIAIAQLLNDRGCPVIMTDPVVNHSVLDTTTIEYRADPLDAARGAGCIVVATEWPQYRAIDPRVVRDVVATRHVLDARNCLDDSAWTQAGFMYSGVGRTRGGSSL